MTAPRLPDPGAWRAVSVPLPPGRPIDPIALAAADGVLFDAPWLTLAGLGAAVQLPLEGGIEDPGGLEAAHRWLAHVPVDDRVRRAGSGLVAQASLPFRRTAPGRLVVPRLTYGRDAQGHEWATVVDADQGAGACADPDPPQLRAALAERSASTGTAAPGPRPGTAEVVVDSGPAYPDAVADAVAAIRRSTLRKVVLARVVQLRFAAPVDVVDLLARLRAQEPTCTAFSHPVGGGRFVGASPELLVSRRGRAVRCQPLAGTVGLPGDLAGDAAAVARLQASVKDQGEHHLVVEELAGALGARCSELRVPDEPSPVRLRSVAHLATTIEGLLAAGAAGAPGVLDLLADLHPTAAVAGVPRRDALALLEQLETGGRGHWAGPVGWLDARGDGDFMIGIRSATVRGADVTVHAGCGVVAASDPAAELAETLLKLGPVLESLTPGLSALLTPSARGAGTDPAAR